MENLKKSLIAIGYYKKTYEEWLFHYRTNNLGWDQLAKHQQFVLIRIYKRKLHSNDTLLDKVIASDIRKDLNINSECSDAEALELTNCIRYRLAI